MEPEALRRRARLSQSGAEHEQSRIAGHEFDPDYIRALDHFPALSHQRLHDAVEAMNPGDMHRAAESWVTIADSMFGALTTLHATVQSALAEGMSGEMATAADHSARRFITEATATAEIAQSTGHRILAAAYGAEALRKTVPPPMPHGSPNAREELRQMALAALDANYTPIYPPSGAGIPAFFPITPPGDGDAGENAGDTAGSDPGSDAALGTPPHPTPPLELHPAFDVTHQQSRPPASAPVPDVTAADAAAAQRVPHTATPSAGSEDAVGRPPIRANRDGVQTTRLRPADTETKPATYEPGEAPGAPLSPTALSPAPTGKPTTAWPRPTPDTPDPGRSFPSPPNLESPTRPRPLIPTNPPESPAAGLPPGMFAPASRSTSDSDTLHRSPSWLIRDRQQELLGTPLPHVCPTIGAEILAARNDLAQPDNESP